MYHNYHCCSIDIVQDLLAAAGPDEVRCHGETLFTYLEFRRVMCPSAVLSGCSLAKSGVENS